MPRTAAATDLTRVSLPAVNGQPVVEIAEATLKSGARMAAAWDALEPVVRTLTVKVQAYCNQDEIQGKEAAQLLDRVASVIHKVGAASTGMLRSSEGLARLSVLLDAGRVRRTQPEAMTQKQLAATVIETVKRIAKDTGSCPICTETVEVSNGHP